jgi:hypothetical protein
MSEGKGEIRKVKEYVKRESHERSEAHLILGGESASFCEMVPRLRTFVLLIMEVCN